MRNKASRPCDGMVEFSEEHKQRAAKLTGHGGKP